MATAKPELQRLVDASLATTTSREEEVCLSQNVSVAEEKGGVCVCNEGSFSLTNTVTHLPVK